MGLYGTSTRELNLTEKCMNIMILVLPIYWIQGTLLTSLVNTQHKCFKNWCYQKITTKKMAHKLTFFIKKIEKDSDDFWLRKFESQIMYFIPIITTKFVYYAAFRGCPLIKLWHFLISPHYTNSQNSSIFFRHVSKLPDVLGVFLKILISNLEEEYL